MQRNYIDIEILEQLDMGNRKLRILKHLLDNMDNNNCINTTMREIAVRTQTSRSLVNDTIKALREAGLIEREGTVYMISSHLMVSIKDN